MSASAELSAVKGNCPSCGANRLANVVKHYHRFREIEETDFWINTDYQNLAVSRV